MGGRGALASVPHPLTGQLEKVSTYRKFGSFLHPKHKSEAQKSGLCVGKGGESLLQQSGLGPWSSPGRNCLLSLPRPPGPACWQHPHQDTGLCGPGRSPLCRPSRACVPITPTQTALLQSKQINAMGRAKTPTPKSQTSSSCPILFSRLKNKIQTIGEQRSQAALGSTRTKGLCTTIR